MNAGYCRKWRVRTVTAAVNRAVQCINAFDLGALPK
jgi:hypothetical protein